MSFQIQDLPNELIYRIVDFLSPKENAKLQATCRRFRDIAINRMVWKEHCKSFKYWSPHHNYAGNLAKPIFLVDWRKMYCTRQRRNMEAEKLLTNMIEQRAGRLLRLEKLSMLGEDSKEFLLEQMALQHWQHPEALTRRFHADIALNSMHRAMAVFRWIGKGPNRDMLTQVSSYRELRYSNSDWNPQDLEDGIAAFDMFAPVDISFGVSWSKQRLDAWAEQFRQDTPDIATMTTRDLAVTLNQWLRAKRYVGCKAVSHRFYYLKSIFLGQAIDDEEHISIPLIQCVIYCGIARRLGLRADCCPFPGKLHVIVRPPSGLTVDGREATIDLLQADSSLLQVILDPYDKDGEVSLHTMQQALSALNFHEPDWLKPANPSIIIARHARNVQVSCERIRSMTADLSSEASALPGRRSYNNVLSAAYAALWAAVTHTPSWHPNWKVSMETLQMTVKKSWPEDTWILQRFVTASPLGYTTFHSPSSTMMPYRPRDLEWERDRVIVRNRHDFNPPPLYHVGQIFRHAKYRSVAVITGWRPIERESATESFYYYCLGGSNALPALVVESNIEVINAPIDLPDELVLRCGKYFKNYDVQRSLFISNMETEYPYL